MITIKVGTYNQADGQELVQHTSYAADYINHKAVGGEYDVMLGIEGGYTIPMPYWIFIRVNTVITDGKTFSGFCGNNFASRDVETGASTYTIQTYSYHLPKMVADGRVTLLPEFEWLNQETSEIIKHIQNTGWKPEGR